MAAEVKANLNACSYQESCRKQPEKGFFGFGKARRRGKPGIKLLNQVVEPIGCNV